MSRQEEIQKMLVKADDLICKAMMEINELDNDVPVVHYHSAKLDVSHNLICETIKVFLPQLNILEHHSV